MKEVADAEAEAAAEVAAEKQTAAMVSAEEQAAVQFLSCKLTADEIEERRILWEEYGECAEAEERQMYGNGDAASPQGKQHRLRCRAKKKKKKKKR